MSMFLVLLASGFGVTIFINSLLMVQVWRKSPSIAHVKTPITVRIMKAGIAAIAHFTINATIERNGIWMSVTTTFCLFSSSSIGVPFVPIRSPVR